MQAAVETYGQLDVVVNNAGILRDRMLVNMKEQEWDEVIRVHLKGTAAVSRAAAAHWRERSKGGGSNDARIINTSSGSGLFGNIGQSNYGAAKAGIASFSIIAALELERPLRCRVGMMTRLHSFQAVLQEVINHPILVNPLFRGSSSWE